MTWSSAAFGIAMGGLSRGDKPFIANRITIDMDLLSPVFVQKRHIVVFYMPYFRYNRQIYSKITLTGKMVSFSQWFGAYAYAPPLPYTAATQKKGGNRLWSRCRPYIKA